MSSKTRILIPCKQVIDYAVKVRLRQDGKGAVKENTKLSINPFDEIAVEEALRLKKTADGKFAETTAISIGPAKSIEVLRHALALGVDTAIHIETCEEVADSPLSVARILCEYASKNPDIGLIIMGKQAIDDDSSFTGQILSGMLNWPLCTFASKVKLIEENKLRVDREIETGINTSSVTMPAVITTDLRLNTPRYASLQNIMRSRSRKIEVTKVSGEAFIKREEWNEPSGKKAGIICNTVEELLNHIKPILN